MVAFNFTFDLDTAGGLENFTGLDGARFNNSNTVTADVNGTTDFTVQFNVSSSSGGFAFDFAGAPDAIAVAGGQSVVLDLVPTGATDFYFSSLILSGISGSGSYDIELLNAVGGTLASYDETSGASILYSAADVYSIRITSNVGVVSIDGMSGDYNCFTAGTQIATPNGAKNVEDIVQGDVVRTADGDKATVSWLGVLPVDTLTCDTARAYPIRITAGALGNGLPQRDLELSGDHAVEIDGVLFNASTLVNGATIFQVLDMPVDGFRYYHVELEEGHKLLLADGLAAESFLGMCEWGSFENDDQRRARIIPEMALPRVSSARLMPAGLRKRLGVPTCRPLDA